MTYLDLLRAKLKDARQGTEQNLLMGRVNTFDEYRYLAGVLAGLSLAENIMDEVEEQTKR